MKTVDLGPLGNRSSLAIQEALYKAGLLDTTDNPNPPKFGPGDMGLGLTWTEQDDNQTIEEATLYISVSDDADEAEVLSIVNNLSELTTFVLDPREDIEILIDVIAEELSIDKDNLYQKFLDRRSIAPRKFPRGS